MNLFSIDSTQLYDLSVRLGIDLVTIIGLVHFIYFKHKKEREFAFTFFLFNVIIFFVSFLMKSAEMSMGFAFGLFAIFGILRYRTDTMPIKEMTYLLAAIAIALVNTLVDLNLIALIINFFLLISTWWMERLWFGDQQESKTIMYENIELTHLDRYEELLEDLQGRTGLNIDRIRIKSLNYLNDSAQIKIYYRKAKVEKV